MKRFAVAPLLPLAAALVALGGCSNVPEMPSVLTPYRMDVRQGNFVTKEMSSQLQPGQTKDQVRFILGSPLIADLFHGDRWDYVYLLQPGRGEQQQRRLSVYFADGKLVRVDGDVVADENLAARDKLLRTPGDVIEIKSDAPAAAARDQDKASAKAAEKPAEKSEAKPEAASGDKSKGADAGRPKFKAMKLEPQMTMPGSQ